MVAYVIADIDITDAKLFDEYRQLVPPTIAEYGGRFLVRGGAIAPLEGDWSPSRIVILEFPDSRRAKEWLDSPGYAGARRMRQKASSANIIVVEGVPT